MTGLRDLGRSPCSPEWSASRRGLQRAHAHEVVGRRREQELPVHLASAAVAKLAQPANGLHTAEDFFDPLSSALADRITRMSRGSPIERPALLLLGDVRRDTYGFVETLRALEAPATCRRP